MPRNRYSTGLGNESRAERRPGRRALGGVVVLLLIVVLAVPGLAAPDPERFSTTPTGWAWFNVTTESNLNTYITENQMRLGDIEVIKNKGPKFAATMVHNSGPYHSPSWHWYYGLTFKKLTNLEEIKSGRERVLDVDNYLRNGKRRYAVVTVNNQGEHAKKWWWYLNVSKSFIKSKLKNKRIIDLEPRKNSSKYDVVMIANKGEDNKAWWYYYKRTPAQIKNLLKEKKARLVDIERDGNKFTVVMVKRSGEYWWWYHGLKKGRIAELAAQNGARIFDIERYSTGKGPRYAVLMLNNLDALSTKLRQIMKPGTQKAAFGFYLKEVNGPVYAALQSKKVFEPASMIKVLHLLHAMRAVQIRQATLTEPITWFVHPDAPARYPGDTGYGDGDKNVCAYNSDGSPITSNPYTDPLGQVILRQMMEQSDNRATDATVNRFGMDPINETADDVGMNDTQLNHRINCPAGASPSPFKRNEITLHDAGLLYEGVSDGSQLSPALRPTFYDYMNNGVGGWKSVVDEEAAALGKSQQVADDFLAAMETATKAGGYTSGATCPSGTSGTCELVRRTGFGVLRLPFKSAAGRMFLTDFVYGSFVDGVFKCGANCDGEIDKIKDVRSEAHREMLRPRIKAALATW